MPLTPALQNIVGSASRLHLREQTSHITWRQLLLALLGTRKCAAATMFQAFSFPTAELHRDLLAVSLEEDRVQAGPDSAWSLPAEAAFRAADNIALTNHRPVTGTGEMLLAIRQTCPVDLERLLEGHGWTANKFGDPPGMDDTGGIPLSPFIAFAAGTMVFAAGRIISWGDPVNYVLAIIAAATAGWISRAKSQGHTPASIVAGPPCHKCGYNSDIVRHFRLGCEGSLCLACAEREPVRTFQNWVIYSIILLIVGLALLATVETGWGLVNFALLLLLPTFLVNLHELGHVVVAKLLGIEVPAVIAGRGPVVATFRLFGTTWSWHRHVTHGLALLLPTGEFRFRYFLAILGGPATNLALAGFPFLVLSRPLFPEYGWETSLELPEVWVLANLWMACLSLIPQQSEVGPSDGRQMLDILKGRWFSGEALPVLAISGVIDNLAQAGRVLEAQSLTNRGLAAYPESLSLVMKRASLHCQSESYPEARADALEIIFRANAGPLYLAAALNTAAWSNLFLGPEYMEEALEFSQRALEIEPDSPYHIGTRGTVLLRAGRQEESRDFLDRAIRQHHNASSLAINYSHLALAELGCERLTEATRALANARHFDTGCKELKEAETALQGAGDH